MYKTIFFILLSLLISPFNLIAQNPLEENISVIDINNSSNGFDLLNPNEKQVFFLGETKHALRRTPIVTLKLLEHLHENANTRILALEHGYSVAYLINKYLENQDTTLLRQISRNTMYWGKENYSFLVKLAMFNSQLPFDKKISVRSIDVEYKAEPVILLIRQLISDKKIPEELQTTIGEFKKIFEEKKEHREQFDGLNVFNYYDRTRVKELVVSSLEHIHSNKKLYQQFFKDDFVHVERIIHDLYHGYVKFDAKKPTRKFRYRDDIIYERFVSLIDSTDAGILCVIGNAHVLGRASGTRKPLKEKSITIMIHAPKKGKISNLRLKSINKTFDGILLTNNFSLIKHSNSKPFRPSLRVNEYSIFANDGGLNTPFENSYFGND